MNALHLAVTVHAARMKAVGGVQRIVVFVILVVMDDVPMTRAVTLAPKIVDDVKPAETGLALPMSRVVRALWIAVSVRGAATIFATMEKHAAIAPKIVVCA